MWLIAQDYPNFHAAVDCVEAFMAGQPQGENHPQHTLTPGLYSRRLFMPALAVVVSKIHRREHQYVVLSGSATVVTESGAVLVRAGYSGITPANTRRVLFVHEWMTFHPTDQTTLEDIEADLILPRQALPEPLTTLSS
jgi:hypothetical protein